MVKQRTFIHWESVIRVRFCCDLTCYIAVLGIRA